MSKGILCFSIIYNLRFQLSCDFMQPRLRMGSPNFVNMRTLGYPNLQGGHISMTPGQAH